MIGHSILVGILVTHATVSLAEGLSESTNGVYLAISGFSGPQGDQVGTNQAIRFDQPLSFNVFCNTGKVEVAYAVDPAYLARITLTGPDGSVIPRTLQGWKFGRKWNQLHDFRDTQMAVTYAERAYPDKPELIGGHILPAPQELFRMRRAGIYSLRWEMQMLRLHRAPNVWEWELFRLSPVTVKVEKPDDEDGSLSWKTELLAAAIVLAGAYILLCKRRAIKADDPRRKERGNSGDRQLMALEEK